MRGNGTNTQYLGGGIEPEDHLTDEMGLQPRCRTDHGCRGLEGVLGFRT